MADVAEAPAAVPEPAADPATVGNGHAEGAETKSDPVKGDHETTEAGTEKPVTDEPEAGKAAKQDKQQPLENNPDTETPNVEAGASLAGEEPPKAEVDSVPVDANTSINKAAVATPTMDTKMKDVAEDAVPAAEAPATTAADEAKPTETTEAPAADDDAKKTDGDDETRAEDKTDGAEKEAEAKEDGDAPKDEGKPAEEPAAATPAKKTAVSRRKSIGQKLNRKGSKARIVHLDAKPGDHYFVKLKGYPAWPVIICDEDMLPPTLVKSRPVSAARQDGSYRFDYADGGKRAADRSFPVMYLHTNEFGWVPNQDLHDLDPSTILNAITEKMRKDLQEAHRIAAEHNPLTYFKDMLRQFQEDQKRAQEEALAAAAAKKAAKKAKEVADVDMLDVPADDDEKPAAPAKKSKKRKADEEAQTPQRSNSVKKPKIKITSSGTPKGGAASGTPKGSKADKASKPKAKSSKAEEKAPKEPELSPEEKQKRKSKEVLFLRHKIQKGLLTSNVEPKAEDMKLLSDYLTKLEGFPNLEVEVIRTTKIHKVLKAILKIQVIPREDEFKFKPRSQVLLDKWNKRLLTETPAPAAGAGATPAATEESTKKSNGVSGTTNGDAKDKEEGGETNGDAKGESNGVKEDKSEEPAEKEPAAVEAAA